MKIVVAHTPDADDAFMFYAMTNGKIKTNLNIEHHIEDIEGLNNKAFNNELDVTALSAHAYAFLHDRYRILSAGASVGHGYGPIVVSRDEREGLRGKGERIAVPGRYTTANLLLNLAVDGFEPVEMRFDLIVDAVKRGDVDAGLLIHEGQIIFKSYGLKKILDLWDWWYKITKLPMPLGINTIRRDIPEEYQVEFLKIMKESIDYALKKPDEAISYAMRYSRGLDKETTKRFALMYVNDYTYKMPDSVVKAMDILFEMGEEKGLIKKPPLDILY